MNQVIKNRQRYNERGEGGAKLIMFLAVVFLAGYAAVNYVSAFYEAEEFKNSMKASVTNSIIRPPRGVGEVDMVSFVKKNLKATLKKEGMPENANVKVTNENKVIEAQVTYSKKINLLPFGLYQYDYAFNHKVTPNLGI